MENSDDNLMHTSHLWSVKDRIRTGILTNVIFFIDTASAGAPRSKFAQEQAIKRKKKGIVDNTVLQEAGECVCTRESGTGE